MPRAERPLEPDGSALAEFAADLRKLRKTAGGPAYRELARRVHYSSTTLSDAAGGRRLPSLEVTLAYVRACGGDVEKWDRRWRSVAAELAASTTGLPTEDDEAAPYVGLRPYGGGDAGRFFGRERLTEDLLRRITVQRFVAVFGPSGSGKSSLLRAGLVPRLASKVIVFTPGGHPLEECAIQLAAATGSWPSVVRGELTSEQRGLHRLVRQALVAEPPNAEVVIVVDQFEELFTVCQDERERSDFITMLLTATSAASSRCRVVIGVRADFYPQCALRTDLTEALQDAQVTVGPMTSDELRLVITQPAQQARCAVESALLTTLVTQTHGRTGVLPLLSHALLETWRRRKGNTLTLAGFQASGEFDGALAKTAEAAFAALDDHQQALARDLFLRLIALGEGTEDTKRKIGTEELDDNPVLAEVVHQFTQARLLTRSEGSLELAHEALIKAWPRLAAWMAEDRDGQRIHRELTDAAAAWRRHNRDPSVLLRGTRLAVVGDWVDHGGHPSAKEREFLNASIAADTSERHAKRRVVRRQRQLLAVLAAVLLLAVSIAAYATHAQRQANRERVTTIVLKALASIGELSRTNPELAAQLSLAAYRMAPSPPTLDGLIAAAADSDALVPEDNATPTRASVTSDGRTVLHWSAHTKGTQIWRFANQALTMQGTLRGGPYASISADGHIAMTGEGPRHSSVVRIWNTRRPAQPEEMSTLPTPVEVGDLSSDGRLLITIDQMSRPSLPVMSGDSVKLWDLSDPRQPRHVSTIFCADQLAREPGRVMDARFAGTRGAVIECGTDNYSGSTKTVQVWDVGQPEKPRQAGALGVARTILFGSGLLVNGDIGVTKEDHGLTIWDMRNLYKPREAASAGPGALRIDTAAIAPSVNLIAIAGADRRVTIRNTRNPEVVLHNIVVPGKTGVIASLGFESDGKTLVGTGPDPDVSIVWRWVLDPERAAMAVCGKVYAKIAESEWVSYFPGVAYRSPCE
ncbi:helix-turn-helix domain-containing protein [Amycolatopsis sp. NPDC049868]|uniref:nSTAND1 domain-containing NTPase n=1 Tax=Amycolatopsis sp. NPDC049868 TaxID=3363934 RepID=UPI0037A9C81D